MHYEYGELIRKQYVPQNSAHRPLWAKLIFNAISGRSDESPQQLAEILTEMQNSNILPEVYMVHPNSQVEPVVRSAINAAIGEQSQHHGHKPENRDSK
jgi:hypothetical protein